MRAHRMEKARASVHLGFSTFSIPFLYTRSLCSSCSHKTLKVKKLLAVNARRNRPLPQWTRMKTSANPKVKQPKYNSKRKNWRKTKLGI